LALFPRMPAKYLRLGLLLSALLLLTGTGIAGYHAGVEMGIFTGPGGCTSNTTGGESIEELRAQIMNAPLVSCDQAMATFFGLSLAAWNTLVYLFLTFVALYGVTRSY
jgi:disulfide bond formation protein DsbB